MTGVTFPARGWNFGDVFRLLPQRVQSLDWKPSSDFEMSPPGSGGDLIQEVYRLVEDGQVIPSEVLDNLISLNPQVFDGTIAGYESGSDNCAVRIRSVRGDEWDVESDDAELLETIRQSVSGCSDHPASPI